MDELLQRQRFPRETAWWAGGFLLILACHLLWATLNQAPPLWDMAYHESQGWLLLEAGRSGTLWSDLAQLSPHYPPLFYLQEAAWIRVLGASPLLGVLANLGALLMLSWSTWRVARRALGDTEAVAAGMLVLLFPMVAWVSRETLLDPWLAAWVSLAAFFLLKSRGLQSLGWTAAFGWAVAGGVLTKWTCPLYLAFPTLWCWWRSRNRWRAMGSLCLAAALSIPLILPYYLPNLADLWARYPTTEQSGLIPWKPYPRHGEPGLNNPWGWIYYPRVLAGYYLQLPLLLLLAGGFLRRRRHAQIRDTARQTLIFLGVWLGGGLLAVTLLSPKDPRFALPLAPPLAILLLILWRGCRRALWVILGVALLAFLMASFPTPLGPFRAALGKTVPDPDFQGLQREWALLQTHYFGVAGPPLQQDWRQADLLAAIPDDAAVGFLPDAPRFHLQGLRLEAVRQGRTLDLRRLGSIPEWRRQLASLSYVVGKTGLQGISFTTPYNSAVMAALAEHPWVRVAAWPLPDGSQALLWRRSSSGRKD